MIPALCIVLALAMYFAWAYVHEFSHLTAARRIVGVDRHAFTLYPHVSQDHFYWARISYWFFRDPTPIEQAWISIAPRYADMVAAFALTFAYLIPDPWFWFYSVVFGAGLVDFFVGSIGWNPNSDLRRAAAGFNVSPWWFRVVGFSSVAASVATWALLRFA